MVDLKRDEAERLLDEYDMLCMTGTLDDKMKARAAVIAAMTRATPPGWKLVPVEPTEAMCRAGRRMTGELAMSMRGYDGYVTDPDTSHWPEAYEYRVMLAAAPEAPKEGIT